ncbi:unnamed protein product [Parnassius apollo]|uniref:(apollo) hypothetical protein n=1 Tax=Parnassius apollo TaxID=110799 RepID=A0A8S3Y9I2_PARAO|nr:unnamed protein product [Parnassius apollo]
MYSGTSNNRQYNLKSSKNLDTSLDEQGPGYIECLENTDFACEPDSNENVQTNLIENINAPDHSIPASSAIENCLKNDANITDINGENIFE